MIQRIAAYISQYDLHIGEMTVRETLAFSARCQGVGSRYGKLKNICLICKIYIGPRNFNALCLPGSPQQFVAMLAELLRREKEANIKPDPDIDVFMKVKRLFTVSGLYRFL